MVDRQPEIDFRLHHDFDHFEGLFESFVVVTNWSVDFDNRQTIPKLYFSNGFGMFQMSSGLFEK